MKRMTRGLMAVALAGAISMAPTAGIVGQPFVTTVYAHHGGGCHGGGGYGYGGGGYHGGGYGGGGVCYYYCDGHAAHLHNNGVCPYAAPALRKASTQTVSRATVKKVQRRLNKLGYHCGKADGIMGARTKKALRQYKKHHGMHVDATIKRPVLRKLGLLKK